MSIIKARIRGYGKSLGWYLLKIGNNEEVRIIEVDGDRSGTDRELIDLLTDFSLNEKLTRSKQGIYHASINPSLAVAQRMSDDEWLTCVDILANELGFESARRAVVLHKGDGGRPHVHVAFERYDNEAGKMRSVAHNFRRHDRARLRIEKIFADAPTPNRNANRKKMKECLTRLWNETTDAKSFMALAKQEGYTVAAGYEQGKIVVIDQMPRAFKLVSHLEGIRVAEVRERFKGVRLANEKDALAFINTQRTISEQSQKPIVEESAFAKQLQKMKQRKQSLKPRMR